LRRRGHERSGGAARVGLLLDRDDLELRRRQRGGESTRVVLGELHGVGVSQLPLLVEVAAVGDAPPVDRGQPGVEAAGSERRHDVPVLRCDEPHAIALALDHEPRRDRLDASCR
jgi:hypothetical protein